MIIFFFSLWLLEFVSPALSLIIPLIFNGSKGGRTKLTESILSLLEKYEN